MPTLAPPSLRLLEPFQHGETPTLIAHIEEGLRVFNEYDGQGGEGGEAAAKGEKGKALLVFSGWVAQEIPPSPAPFFFVGSVFKASFGED